MALGPGILYAETEMQMSRPPAALLNQNLREWGRISVSEILRRDRGRGRGVKKLSVVFFLCLSNFPTMWARYFHFIKIRE